MAHEREVYVDGKAVRDLGEFWERCCEDLFTEANLYTRRRARTHPIVSRTLDAFDDERVAEFTYLYASATSVRQRLQILGYTPERCKALWEKGHAEHQMNDLAAKIEAYYVDSDQLSVSRSWTYETWQADYFLKKDDEIFDLLWSAWHWDPFATLAMQIDALRPKAVWMDLSDLYPDTFDPSLTVRENLARYSIYDEEGPTGKTLILTEGKSDTKILSSALAALYPEVADLYDFMDFEEFSIEGGASPLARMVKSFAGVKQQIRILAIFDNDAAGQEALATLARVPLPSNIRLMALPRVRLAERYPTIGPEGFRTMDVNGSACSIELFLGRKALTGPDRKLNPVRWSQWNANVKRYQGKLECKDAAAKSFLATLSDGNSPARLRQQFPEMNQLLQTIFDAF